MPCGRHWPPIPAGDDVIAVVATGGTTNAGIVDDLDGVADVAEERKLWFHVDGAYGAAALFAPSVRQRFRGIERVDSFVVDPHKWLFAPFDCAALLYREPRLAKAVHSQDASYLEVLHTDAPEEWNPSDYAYHLTRRARGMPLWFSLAVNGTDAYRDAVETVLVGDPGGGRPHRGDPPPRAGPAAGAVGGAVPQRPVGASRTTRRGRTGCWTSRSASSCTPPGRARRWDGWPSSTRTPRSS